MFAHASNIDGLVFSFSTDAFSEPSQNSLHWIGENDVFSISTCLIWIGKVHGVALGSPVGVFVGGSAGRGTHVSFRSAVDPGCSVVLLRFLRLVRGCRSYIPTSASGKKQKSADEKEWKNRPHMSMLFGV